MNTEETEAKIEDEHTKALAVCELVTETKSLRTALTLQKLSASAFYRVRREHSDVAKAWADAQNILAELKLSAMDELGSRLIDEEGLTAGTYTAVTKNDRWIIEKLNPAVYGARPTATQTSLVQNNVQILHTLTDEQILAIANGTKTLPQPLAEIQQPDDGIQDDKKVLDNTIDAEYSESCSGEDILETKSFSQTATAVNEIVHESPAEPINSGVKYDLSAFGDLL